MLLFVFCFNIAVIGSWGAMLQSLRQRFGHFDILSHFRDDVGWARIDWTSFIFFGSLTVVDRLSLDTDSICRWFFLKFYQVFLYIESMTVTLATAKLKSCLSQSRGPAITVFFYRVAALTHQWMVILTIILLLVASEAQYWHDPLLKWLIVMTI